MIKTIEQDLLSSNCEVIAHQANLQKRMASGIALSIKNKWPEVYESDLMTETDDLNKLGSFSVGILKNRKDTSIKEVLNLYGQRFYGTQRRQTNYEAIYSSLEAAKIYIISKGYKSFGLPYNLSSGLAGADFRIIQTMIEVIFEKWDGDVIICKLPQKKLDQSNII